MAVWNDGKVPIVSMVLVVSKVPSEQMQDAFADGVWSRNSC